MGSSLLEEMNQAADRARTETTGERVDWLFVGAAAETASVTVEWA